MDRPVRSLWIICGAALAGLCVSSLSASAEPRTAVNSLAEASIDKLRGDWNFSTDFYRSGYCQMSGRLTVFSPKSETPSAACSLTAVEVCGEERSVVEQSCEISLEDDAAVIESEIEQFIERKSNSLGYLPDNFSLSNISSDEMSGALKSAVSARVIFRRAEGAIS